MGGNRRIFSDNEKLLLYNEVDGRCPMCGDNLAYQKNNRIYKSFEVAHIYPANPKKEEKETLKDVLRLDSDVNSMKNVIAVCTKCHTIFDNPRTVQEYNKWYYIKKKLVSTAEMKSTFSLYTIESEIQTILEKLNDEQVEKELIELSLNSLKVDEKADETLPYAIKRSIKNDVVDYFDYIKRLFTEIDKLTPKKFDTLAS